MIKGSTKVGEVFVCNKDTNGKLEQLPQFLGKALTGFGGGFNKLFVLEEGEGFEGVVSSLHPPENDIDRLFEDNTNRRHDTSPDHPGQIKEQKVMEFEDGNYDNYDDHQESELANQDEINYMNQMRDSEQYQDHYNEGFPQDPNIQEYQNMQNEYDGDTKMHRTRGSDRSNTGGDRARTPASRFEMGNTRTIHENMGHLKQIVSSKNHILQLTRDGFVFSYGTSDFSVAGHGGSTPTPKPKILKHLSDKRVIQIACGEHHSLVLTDKNDVYGWGRGFEGQLGISQKIEIASKPNYVKAFFGTPVIFIAAGASYSLAITHENRLYGWGEARLGQLGLGVKTRIVRTPVYIPVYESEQIVNSKGASSDEIQDQNPKFDTYEAKIVYCSAGLGHTAAISDEGDLYVWGFNNCGQLGVGDKKSRWEPIRVEKDIMGNILPQIQKAVCSYYSTYAIDTFGNLYSWGKGYIGHSDLTIEDLPRKIEINTENRIFTDVFCNKDIVSFYAPIRVYSISPNCGPAAGGTHISIIGTGFIDSDKLRVRFSYANLSQEESCSFDPKTKSLYCKTPKFEEFQGQTHPSLRLPCKCTISITTDGLNYSECEESFKIYSNNIYLSSLIPKSGSVSGGAELSLDIDIDDETAKNLFYLTIGFQPKQKRSAVANKSNLIQSSITRNQSAEGDQNDEEEKQKLLNASHHSSMKGSMASIAAPQDDGQINPLDVTESQLDNENWVCSAGYYNDGKVVCVVPYLEEFHPDNLQFSVDIALNGQQFSGHPLQFRYYNIEIKSLAPMLGPSTGGTNMRLIGTGLYDSPIKKIKFSAITKEELKHGHGVREVNATWDRKSKSIA